jgi:hypothetical protein
MTDWTIETDDEAAARQRTGAIDGRYQVCHPDTGLVECCDRLGDAFAIADRQAVATVKVTGAPMYSDPWAFEVFDRMARVGQPTTWKRASKDGTYCWGRGDKYSMDARWVVIKRREPSAS